jgi:hypothetical protein
VIKKYRGKYGKAITVNRRTKILLGKTSKTLFWTRNERNKCRNDNAEYVKNRAI